MFKAVALSSYDKWKQAILIVISQLACLPILARSDFDDFVIGKNSCL